MLSAQQEVRSLLHDMIGVSQDPKFLKSIDRLSTLCGAYMGQDSVPAHGIPNRRLTPALTRIWHLLRTRRGQCVKRQEIFECYHTDPYTDTELKVIDVHMTKLRALLKETEFDNKIETVHGVGYRLVA